MFKLTLVNGGWGISNEIALTWMPLDLTDDKSTLVQVMAWCRQATSHYLSQCWPRSMSPNGITGLQWGKTVRPSPIQYPWISTAIPDTIVKWTLRNKIRSCLSEWNFLWRWYIMGGYHWFIPWLVAKWHQANTTTDVVLSSTRTLGAYLNSL